MRRTRPFTVHIDSTRHPPQITTIQFRNVLWARLMLVTSALLHTRWPEG